MALGPQHLEAPAGYRCQPEQPSGFAFIFDPVADFRRFSSRFSTRSRIFVSFFDPVADYQANPKLIFVEAMFTSFRFSKICQIEVFSTIYKRKIVSF